jgi:hypothetical protein
MPASCLISKLCKMSQSLANEFYELKRTLDSYDCSTAVRSDIRGGRPPPCGSRTSDRPVPVALWFRNYRPEAGPHRCDLLNHHTRFLSVSARCWRLITGRKPLTDSLPAGAATCTMNLACTISNAKARLCLNLLESCRALTVYNGLNWCSGTSLLSPTVTTRDLPESFQPTAARARAGKTCESSAIKSCSQTSAGPP